MAESVLLIISTVPDVYLKEKQLYIYGMDIDIRFCKSAFKHGISEADIRQAIDTVKYDGYLEDDEDAENKRLLIGFDHNANPLEI